jgi:hypothetical protein
MELKQSAAFCSTGRMSVVRAIARKMNGFALCDESNKNRCYAALRATGCCWGSEVSKRSTLIPVMPHTSDMIGLA